MSSMQSSMCIFQTIIIFYNESYCAFKQNKSYTYKPIKYDTKETCYCCDDSHHSVKNLLTCRSALFKKNIHFMPFIYQLPYIFILFLYLII